MAINNDVQDIDNFPGTIKRVTLDVDQVVPTDQNGDEKMMMVASTAAYSDNEDRTAIQSIYTMGAKIGWAKSSGLRGAVGKFNITDTANKLAISMDSTVSGVNVINGKGYYEIALEYNNSTPISGEDIAVDMQNKIRAVTCNASDVGYQLAYLNSDVEFVGGKFYISSGTIANNYTGTLKSAVSVKPAQTENCSDVLGFDQQVTSEDIADQNIIESRIVSDYTAGTTPLSIGLDTGAVVGDCICISDGTNTDYCTVLGVSNGDLTVPTTATNSFDGIANSYLVADGAYIQIIRKQDPDVVPNSYCTDVDSLFRYMSKSIINQIDFSS